MASVDWRRAAVWWSAAVILASLVYLAADGRASANEAERKLRSRTTEIEQLTVQVEVQNDELAKANRRIEQLTDAIEALGGTVPAAPTTVIVEDRRPSNDNTTATTTTPPSTSSSSTTTTTEPCRVVVSGRCTVP